MSRIPANPSSKWSTTRLGYFIAANSRLTGSDSYMLALALSSEPMADLWNEGVAEGKRRQRMLQAEPERTVADHDATL